MISAKVGVRNLARNRWRSGLTLAGIALSVAFMVWMIGFMDGWLALMVRGATAVETAQLQVHTRAFAENGRVYESFGGAGPLMERIRGVEGVEAVAPRLRLYGLLGHEARSQVGRILGVDPVLEAATTPVAEAVVEGRWLGEEPPPYPAPREVVLGQGLAQQLRVGPGDELVVFLEAADGSLGNDLLEVVGVVRTGNTGVDRMTAYLHLEDARALAALEGEVHELSVRTRRMDEAPAVAARVAAALGRGGGRPGSGEPPSPAPGAGPAGEEAELLVRPWQEILPSLHQILTVSKQSYWMMYLLVYLVAAVGILNTQRMSALERRRELGVLMAIGMRPRRIFGMVLAESLVMGLLGGVLGTALGTAVTWHHATAGFDMSLFTDQPSFSYMGVAFSHRIHALLTPTAVLQPASVMVLVALLAGLWPAASSARLEPAPTIAGRG